MTSTELNSGDLLLLPEGVSADDNVIVGGDDAILGDDAFMGDNATMGVDGFVGDSARVGVDGFVGDSARVGVDGFVGDSARVGVDGFVGDSARVGDDAAVVGDYGLVSKIEPVELPTTSSPLDPVTEDGEMTIAAKLAGIKRKRNLPGTPDPDAEVMALSPRTLMATHKFTCEVCGRGFQREQNLQLHKRGHNLPGSLKPRANKDKEVRKKVYVCPEATCVHHDPSRALGDLTGIKKHFCRKHGEKKWNCEKCSKKYAVLSDWKAHSKTCGTRDYKCDCGSVFYRRDSFVTHKAFCDELAEESAKLAAG